MGYDMESTFEKIKLPEFNRCQEINMRGFLWGCRP